ncbi:branched-chain amino acid ABC transporter substrate-binding protein [Undibacterium sp. RTI2.1]|uniref:branched-chain amino acid ABC transporter substrate-binding protein n=1 Tax=unclassified Undibacterium TaxID=2630295 RepID=UPI002B23061C|nr:MULTISPECIES: branched-chain amino acid ABC transporter substrate-binding protein [unclassified Undibacterium]MEB0031740.1 branched-chain amino acid ABC transporter substrate-binding protein [Undibacterium sp. RTI2.1]MEB0118008.1 branched-chain amino acid ABC transporter substrate-binding protein [Undibacterium sp. RTI2.2]
MLCRTKKVFRWIALLVVLLSTAIIAQPALSSSDKAFNAASSPPSKLSSVTKDKVQAAPIRIAMIDGMSGAFSNAGEAVVRNLQLAIEQVNAHGGVRLPDGRHPLSLSTFDNKQGVEDSLTLLNHVTDQDIPFIVQGNSSAVALALVDAINKHNQRVPQHRVLFLNYSAVEPSLTNEKCSFWHFRFDANADMRMNVLTDVIRDDAHAKKVYLVGQDYSFGRQVASAARSMLAAKRPDMTIVGEDLHPIGKIKDFAPYAAKIKASGADTVITGNWGNDLTLLIKAVKEAGMDIKFYTFYANALGAPAAIADAGVGRVRAVAEWHPNVGGAESDAFYQSFRQRYPDPRDDYVHLRMQVMIRMLVTAIEKAGSVEAAAVAKALEGASFKNGFHDASMRASDHQLIQPLYVSVMQKRSDSSRGTLDVDAMRGAVRFDNEGSGYGFKTERYFPSRLTALPTSCKMSRFN